MCPPLSSGLTPNPMWLSNITGTLKTSPSSSSHYESPMNNECKWDRSGVRERKWGSGSQRECVFELLSLAGSELKDPPSADAPLETWCWSEMVMAGSSLGVEKEVWVGMGRPYREISQKLARQPFWRWLCWVGMGGGERPPEWGLWDLGYNSTFAMNSLNPQFCPSVKKCGLKVD